MSNGKIRRMFPGGNTCLGFCSKFEYIIDIFEASRVYIIKGGPGVGKSTFMRNIGLELCKRGYDVDFMQCASDNDSLDGIAVPAINTAMIDGTAPHIVDPRIPGAVDEIINLGGYWNEKLLKDNKKAIITTGKEITDCFERAYRYLKAAWHIMDDISCVYRSAFDENGISIELKRTMLEFANIDRFDLFDANPPERGKVRRLFASALTPSGPANYLDTLIDTPYICTVKGSPGTGTDKYLEKIADYFTAAGYFTEAYYCGFNPAKLEHLIIPSAGVSFTTVNEFHGIPDIDADLEIDMDGYVESMKLSSSKNRLDADAERFNDLLYAASDSIGEAKTAHDYMEGFYKASMDFAAIKALQDQTLSKLSEYG